MPKKQRNSFYFFMKELQDRYREEGRLVSMKDLPGEAHPIWKQMTEEEKAKYEIIAKNYKAEAKGSVEGKLCSDGTPLLEQLKMKEEEDERAAEAIQFVEKLVWQAESAEAITEMNFCVMYFNVLCYTDEDEFIPNEVGIAKYSLKYGIEDIFHKFIDPGNIPIGYTRASKDHSEDTHNIPISRFELADSNYAKIYKSIKDFVNPENKIPIPVFCMEDERKQNQSCIDWLCRKAGDVEVGMIQYFDMTNLLMELRAYIGNPFPAKALSSDILRSHAFDYTCNTRCQYHEDLDNAFCALGYAKRKCFMLSDALCELYDIECTPAHLPPRIGGNTQFETITPSLPPARPLINKINVPLKTPKEHTPSTIIPLKCSGTIDENNQLINRVKEPPLNLTDDDFPPLGKFNHTSNCNTKQPQTSPSVLSADDLRQPNTLPQVLGMKNLDKRFALLGLGRGIGRGQRK